MYELFDCITGRTLGYKDTVAECEAFIAKGALYDYILDYLPTEKALDND